jgi:hypothetical protein
MVWNRSTIFVVGVSLAVGVISTSAIAQSKNTKAIATRDVRQLLQLMDKDKNGPVSKQEFMDFMSQTFDRLDVNKSGQLEQEEAGLAGHLFAKRYPARLMKLSL